MSQDLAARAYATLGVAKLPGYLQRQRWQEMVGVFAAELQELDDAIVAVTAQLHLDTATSAMLDILGSRVGQPRAGMLDAAYRTAIRGRVAVQRSLGLSEDVVKVARLVLNTAALTVTIRPEPPAALAIVVGGEVGTPDALAQALIDSARSAVPAGVRVVVESSALPDSETFSFFDGPGVGFAGTPPTINLSGLCGSGFTTVIGLRRFGAEYGTGAYVFSFVPDAGAPAGGSLAGTAESYAFHFLPGVTTILDFEHQIDTGDNEVIYLVSPSGVAGAIADPADAFTNEPWDGGTGSSVGAFATAKD